MQSGDLGIRHSIAISPDGLGDRSIKLMSIFNVRMRKNGRVRE